mmetsp:Transcript_25273/g.49446  ORF Transcript_25273/g.49446 Transcript_25273/m.49446 type:complete len:150 (-) Transcript_25273:199-648(-)
MKGEHKCFRGSMDADCPVCGEYMFTSTRPVRFMQCGHCIHSQCYEQYSRHHYTCPLCRKSLADMSLWFQRIDQVLQTHVMPEEFKNTMARIHCNDCEKDSEAPYHFVYHKCAFCGSFNTLLKSKFEKSETKYTEDSSGKQNGQDGPQTN